MIEGLPESAEFRTFCRALRNNPQEKETLAGEITQEGCDWPRILEGAGRHRLEHQLLIGLSGIKLPPDMAKTLREAAQEAARGSLMQMREIARIAADFDRAGLPIIALKGVALSVQLGRDPAHRNSRDMDFLIPNDALSAADAVMRGAGYRIEGPDVSTMATSYRRWNKEVKYFHPENRTLVELHYRLVDNAALLDYDFDDLWQERELVKIAGTDVAVMPRHRLPVYLCAHGTAHAWERLCWLSDLAAALPSERSVKEAIALAAVNGLEAPMLQAVLLAHHWLGCAVGPEELAQARESRKVARLNANLIHSFGPSAWFHSPRRGSLAGFLRYSIWLRRHVYALKSDRQYQRFQLERELIAPADWDTFHLPQRISWAYPLLRPVGWIVRRLRGTA